MRRTILLLVSCISLATVLVAEDRYLYAYCPAASSNPEMEKWAAWVQSITGGTALTIGQIHQLPSVQVGGEWYYRVCVDVTKPCGKHPPLKVSAQDVANLQKEYDKAIAVTANSKTEAQTKAVNDFSERRLNR